MSRSKIEIIVDTAQVSTVLGCISDVAMEIHVTPVVTLPIKKGKRGAREGYRRIIVPGKTSEQLVLEKLAVAPMAEGEIEAYLVGLGYSAGSLSPTLSKLNRSGVAEATGRGGPARVWQMRKCHGSA